MALTADQLAAVREEIGTATPPSDADLDVIHERVGGLVGVVRAVWRVRLANLLATPASLNVPGQVGLNWGANIKAIQERLAELSRYPDDSDDLPGGGPGRPLAGVSRLVRDGSDAGRSICLPDPWE